MFSHIYSYFRGKSCDFSYYTVLTIPHKVTCYDEYFATIQIGKNKTKQILSVYADMGDMGRVPVATGQIFQS